MVIETLQVLFAFTCRVNTFFTRALPFILREVLFIECESGTVPQTKLTNYPSATKVGAYEISIPLLLKKFPKKF